MEGRRWQTGPMLAAARAQATQEPQSGDAAPQPIGTQPRLSECHPSLPPPEKIVTRKPAAATGFQKHPENRWRPGMRTHNHVRILPKEDGWRPHTSCSKLSETDVATIRGSKRPGRDLAVLFGVCEWTIKAVRRGERGNGETRGMRPLDAWMEPEKLVGSMVSEMLGLARQYQRLMRLSLKRERSEAAAKMVEESVGALEATAVRVTLLR